MNFYIKKIKLWFSTHNHPIEYLFEKNKVNVVTGDSSTGKSSILRVIDYCLLSRESTIVEDIINENVAWYGLSFHLNGHDYVIARNAPTNGRTGHDFYWKVDTDEFPGDSFPRPIPGLTRAELIDYLNKEFKIPNIKLEENRQSLTPTFRELMLMSYLTEDIIATSNTYFDTQFNTEVFLDPFVMKLFRLGLGADEKKEQDLTIQKQELGKKVKTEEGHKRNDQKNKDAYENLLKRIIDEAEALEIIVDKNEPIEKLITLLKEKIDEFDRLKRSYAKLNDLDRQTEKLRKIKGEIIKYNALRREYRKAVEYSKKLEDSLRPMDYLSKHLNQSLLGEDAIVLYRSLEEAFKSVKGNKLKVDELPEDFEQNYQALKIEEQELSRKISECNQLMGLFFDPNKLMRMVNLNQQIKGLKLPHGKYCGDIELNKLRDKLVEVDQDLLIVSKDNQKKIKKFLEDVQSYYELQTGMSVSYKGCEVDFDEERRKLILKKNGEYFPIKNVGSKSNYMFMHLCFYLGLHQYLNHMKSSIIPNFLFIDQPSIPYYGNNRRRVPLAAGDLTIHNKDDESKLKEAFKLIDSFMRQNVKKENEFQIILVEHADPEYWDDLSYFETKYVFTVEKHYGLIPEYVAPLS